MHVASVDLDADVAVVHIEEVERPLPGADVALTREGGHGDGVSVLEQGHVVAQGSVHVVLRGEGADWMNLTISGDQTHSEFEKNILISPSFKITQISLKQKKFLFCI